MVEAWAPYVSPPTLSPGLGAAILGLVVSRGSVRIEGAAILPSPITARRAFRCSSAPIALRELRGARREGSRRWRGRIMIPWLALARRGLLGGGSGAPLSRGVQTGIQRLQGQTGDSASPAAEEEAEAANNSDFSFYPPAPGKGSTLRWDGKKFEEIPIAHIKATYNNTHILITSHENVALTLSTCGSEGFKSARKATAIAAQTTGIAVAAKASAKGVSHVRVVVKGLGPGRLAAIKGLTMGGLEVISITDDTPIPHNGCRPRKARRL
ncbi:small ribosomal subunit protein uS11m [Podarcis muralis]